MFGCRALELETISFFLHLDAKHGAVWRTTVCEWDCIWDANEEATPVSFHAGDLIVIYKSFRFSLPLYHSLCSFSLNVHVHVKSVISFCALCFSAISNFAAIQWSRNCFSVLNMCVIWFRRSIIRDGGSVATMIKTFTRDDDDDKRRLTSAIQFMQFFHVVRRPMHFPRSIQSSHSSNLNSWHFFIRVWIESSCVKPWICACFFRVSCFSLSSFHLSAFGVQSQKLFFFWIYLRKSRNDNATPA